MDKKQPVRMCIACRTGKPKKELIRLVRGADGCFRVDETGKAQGRGCYVCAQEACVQKAGKIFPKVMRTKMNEGLLETLKGIAKKRES